MICFKSIRQHSQRHVGWRVTTLQYDLSQAIEGWDTEFLAVFFLWMVLTKIRRISIACAKDAPVTCQTEMKHLACVRYDTSLGVLNFNSDNGYIATIGCNRLSIRL